MKNSPAGKKMRPPTRFRMRPEVSPACREYFDQKKICHSSKREAEHVVHARLLLDGYVALGELQCFIAPVSLCDIIAWHLLLEKAQFDVFDLNVVHYLCLAVPFRNRERITFDHLVSMKKPNDTAQVKVLRDGEELEFTVSLRPLQPLVPVHQFDKLPSYFIFAGLLFVPLTQPYLHEYGEDWYNASPRRLCERALKKLPQKAGQQLVILSQEVLMDDINTGYERLADLQVKKVNGIEVDNLKHLRQLVEDSSTENVRFDLDDERVIVLNYDSAKLATSRILKRHRIPSATSNDLIDEQNAPDIELASQKASALGRQ
ncbi:Protease Do-like 10, mitochondrial [Orobanche gracilis]